MCPAVIHPQPSVASLPVKLPVVVVATCVDLPSYGDHKAVVATCDVGLGISLEEGGDNGTNHGILSKFVTLVSREPVIYIFNLFRS